MLYVLLGDKRRENFKQKTNFDQVRHYSSGAWDKKGPLMTSLNLRLFDITFWGPAQLGAWGSLPPSYPIDGPEYDDILQFIPNIDDTHLEFQTRISV